MCVLSDRQIKLYVEEYGMIDPFIPQQVSIVDYPMRQRMERVISYGLSGYGYDIRVGTKFQVFTNIHNTVVDPKNMDVRLLYEKEVEPHEAIVIPPNSFALGVAMERFKIPRHIITICLGKSTYARCGIIVNVTPFEPEWEGYPTLEISNTTTLPAKIYAGEGLAQVLFLKGDDVCEVSYADKKGKYQNQGDTPVLARV